MEVARAAFGYGLPSVDLYRILHNFALDESSPEFKAPLNRIAHSRSLADPDDRSIVAMNVDTPYSYAWLDLRAEPVVLTMPPIPDGRYQAAQLVDLYTYIVGYVSPRTNGADGGAFLVAGPDWTGEAPDGLERFDCPTRLCLVLVRTQVFDDADAAVVALQDAVTVQPLSAWADRPAPEPAPPLVPIVPVDVRQPLTAAFLDVLAWMLPLMPPLPEDGRLRTAMSRLGFDGGAAVASEEVLAGLGAGMGDLAARMRRVSSSAELFGSREFFAGDHLSRSAGAYLGILGNAAEEYLGVGYRADADGNPFDGHTRYTITFSTDGLPPVDAFWSITVYDADSYLYANELDRYVLGSRQVDRMRRNTDGSLTILVQHDRPDNAWLANWLPCPEGPFILAFRTYLPLMEIRQGLWTAPPVQPTKETQNP
jgi:hypothetical protein